MNLPVIDFKDEAVNPEMPIEMQFEWIISENIKTLKMNHSESSGNVFQMLLLQEPPTQIPTLDSFGGKITNQIDSTQGGNIPSIQSPKRRVTNRKYFDQKSRTCCQSRQNQQTVLFQSEQSSFSSIYTQFDVTKTTISVLQYGSISNRVP